MRVLIADCQAIFRHGLVALVSSARPDTLCVEASSWTETTHQLNTEGFDLLLLDHQLLDAPGATDLETLRAQNPELKIAILAENRDRAIILDYLAAGVYGYILKSASAEELLHAVDTIASGGVFAPAALTWLARPAPDRRVAPRFTQSSAVTGMTERQRDVLRLLGEGRSTKDIARRLGLAVGTVKVHLAAVYRLLGAHSRVEALLMAGSIGRTAHPFAHDEPPAPDSLEQVAGQVPVWTGSRPVNQERQGWY